MTKNETGWLLVIDSPQKADGPGLPFAASRPILGLTTALRLALTAQAAGATTIVLAPRAAHEVAPLLRDPRVRIAVIDESDRRGDSWFSVRVPANAVVHRATLQALRTRGSADQQATEFAIVPPLPGRADERAAWQSTPWANAGGTFGFEPMAVVDEASAAAAQRALLRSLRKPQDGWTSTYLNRHISLFITRWLVATPLRPNQVSVAILGVGLAGAALASRGTYETLLVGALLFQAQSVLDGCDGEMSRLTFRGSRTGEWLDTVGDDLTNYGFFAGAAWGLYATSGHALYLVLGAITVLSGLIGSGLEYRYLIRIGSGDLLKYPLGIGKAPSSSSTGPAPKASGLAALVDAISPLFKRDTFVFLTLVGAALGLLGPFLAVFAAGAVGVLVAVIKAELRMASAERGS